MRNELFTVGNTAGYNKSELVLFLDAPPHKCQYHRDGL